MEAEAITLVLRMFWDMTEPRKDNKRHRLIDIISIVLLGVIGGNDDYPSIEEYACDKEPFLRTFLALPAGIPSASTLRRVMGRLEPSELEAGLARWTELFCKSLEGKQVALDGKTLRRSFDHAWKKMGLHVVTAWCVEDQLVLAQQAVGEKSNEIPTVPAILKTLDLKGAVVTADALNCQRKTVQTILEGGADYVLGVKENQPTLYKQVSAVLDEALLDKFKGVQHSKACSYERGHGREEKRTVYASSELVQYVAERSQWPGLKSITMVVSERTLLEKTSVERRYYISSLEGMDAKRMGSLIRGHWGIENSEHWPLDMAFREDESRLRVDHGDQNMAVMRRIALNLLKRDKTVKKGIHSKRLKAGRNDRYMLRVVTQGIDIK
jgi:predicted transposase YbfD/YdcC